MECPKLTPTFEGTARLLKTAAGRAMADSQTGVCQPHLEALASTTTPQALPLKPTTNTTHERLRSILTRTTALPIEPTTTYTKRY